MTDCLIPENNLNNVQFYKSHSRKDVPLEFHLSAGQDNSIVYLKFTVIVGKKSFPYWIHPDDEWLRLFCKIHQASIIDPDKTILVNLNMSKEKLMEIFADIPQCLEWMK